MLLPFSAQDTRRVIFKPAMPSSPASNEEGWEKGVGKGDRNLLMHKGRNFVILCWPTQQGFDCAPNLALSTAGISPHTSLMAWEACSTSYTNGKTLEMSNTWWSVLQVQNPLWRAPPDFTVM